MEFSSQHVCPTPPFTRSLLSEEVLCGGEREEEEMEGERRREEREREEEREIEGEKEEEGRERRERKREKEERRERARESTSQIPPGTGRFLHTNMPLSAAVQGQLRPSETE